MSSCAVMSSQSESFSKESNIISNKLANDLDAKVTSSSKHVLLQRIEFKGASKPDEQYEKLKQKYKPLNQRTPQVNGHDKNQHQAGNSPKKDELPEPKHVLCDPEKISLQWSKLRRVGPGLSNLGNTCYLNSVIQVLTYTPPLVNFLATQEHTRECRAVGFCMMCELQRHILRSFNHHQNESIKPLAIIQRLRCIAKHLRFGHQEDAHEFLRYVIDGMQKSCLHGFEKLDKASKETTVIHRIFSGYYRSQVRCLICHNTSSTFDPLMDVMLDIKQSPTVVRALQRLCKPELLDGDNLYCCLRCKKKVPAHKQVLIHKPPNILTVQLKRFDSNHIFGGKVTKSIEYSEHLDLRPFMTTKGGPVKYKLYAVLVHSGYSSNSGHYYCYVRSSNNSWYNMNDSVVRQVGLNAALSQQAYLLFYTRVVENGLQQEKKPFTPITPKSTTAQAQPGPKLIKENDIGTPLSRNNPPKFPETFTSPTAASNPSTISSEPRQKLSFTIKTPTKVSKMQLGEQKPAHDNQTKAEPPLKHEHISHDRKHATENQAKPETVQKNNIKSTTEAEESKTKLLDVTKDSTGQGSSESKKKSHDVTKDSTGQGSSESKKKSHDVTKDSTGQGSSESKKKLHDVTKDSTGQGSSESKKKSHDVTKDSTGQGSSESKGITSLKDIKPPEPVHVSYPVKKDEKQESPTKNVRPPHLFIPRSVHSKTSTPEAKSSENKKVSLTSPAKATTPWKVTTQPNNNHFIYGPMSPPPKGTPIPQPSPSSVVSDTSSTSVKTGEWDIKDKNIPTPGPILPERQHAGWTVSETVTKTGIQKVDNDGDDDDEESWVEGSSKKSKKKRKKEKRRESKKYEKLNNEDKEGENEPEEETEGRSKQNSDKENKKKHKKKKRSKDKSRRESDRETLVKDKSSDEETVKEKVKKRKKTEAEGQEVESKRQRLVDYTSDDSESLEDQNNNTMENATKCGEKEQSKKEKKDVPVVVYTGNHGDKPSGKATWGGSRNRSTVDELLKGSGGVFGYGDNVTTWEGGESLINAGKNERKREKPRDSWDEELDKGKVKKVKDKNKQEKSSGTNFFQREQDKRNKRGITERVSSHFTRRHSSSHSRSHSSRGYRRM